MDDELLEETFEALAQEAIGKAEEVDCPLAQYRDGLKVMLEALRSRLEQVNEELGD